MTVGRGRLLAAHVVLILMCLAGTAAAQRPTDFSSFVIKTTPVAAGVYQMESPVAGNTAVFVGADGVVLVDPQYAPMHQRLVDAVRKLSSRPIRFLVNTHFHNDHSEGNELLAKLGVVIISHENVRTFLATGKAAGPGQRLVLPSPPAALPMVTYSDSLTLHFNRDEIFIFHPGVAHTDADSIVHFRRANIIHAGDIVTRLHERYPNINSGLIAAVGRMLKLANADTKFVTGHGPVATFKDVQDFHRMMVTIRDRVVAGIQAGKTVEQIIASKPTAEFDAAYKGRTTPEDLVRRVYEEFAKR